jgi:hypothetical protein
MYFLFLLLFVVSVRFVLGDEPVDRGVDGKEIAETMWKEIQAASSEQKMPKEIRLDEYPFSTLANEDVVYVYDYWSDISEQCRKAFRRGLEKAKVANQIELFAQTYVSFFGTKGAAADIRWVMACPLVALPSYFYCKKTPNSPCIEEYDEFALVFCKTIVLKSIQSKEFRRRVHILTLWSGQGPFMVCNKMNDTYYEFIYFLRRFIRKIQREELVDTDVEYWVAIRYFMSIAYLCDLDQVLADKLTKPTSSNVIKASEDMSFRLYHLTSPYVYSSNKYRYDLCNEPRLPPIDPPAYPFEEVEKLSVEERELVLPRISGSLFRHELNEKYFRTLLKPKKKQ